MYQIEFQEMYFNQFSNRTNPQFSCIIEEDGRTAYAYLLIDNVIISDVWLYNTDHTPEIPEWTDKNNAPFRNPKKYSKNPNPIPKMSMTTPIAVEWEMDGEDVLAATIWINEEVAAKLIPYQNPGYCIGAVINGPLAKVLKLEE